MSKIRILEVIRQGLVGGGETHVIDLTTNLNRDIYEPIVLTFIDGPMITTLNKHKIETHIIETVKAFDVKVMRKIIKFVKNNNIDIIHAHGSRACSNVFLAAKVLNIPFIYTIHGWTFHQDQKFPIKQLRTQSENFLTSITTKNICVSHSNHKDGIDAFNMKNTEVVYNGINLKRFDPTNNFSEVKLDLDLNKFKTVVGFIARMSTQKEPLLLIKAMEHVIKKDRSVGLLMVGDGELKPFALELAKSLNIESNIVFSDFRPDIPDVLNACDIYCLPSLWEGLPIGLMEAMAMRKAVIATPADGTVELVEDCENGVLTPFKDAAKLASNILMLHTNIPFRNKIANNAYTTIHQNHSIIKMVDKVEKIYKSII